MPSLMFLQPWFLVGLLAVAVPPLIHLLRRRSRRRVRFSSLRFLQQIDRRSAQRYRLADLLVLALRMLVLGLLALALAQPLLRPAGLADQPFGRLALGLVIDDSLSMQTTEEVGTRFSRALEAGRRVIESLPGDSEVFVLLSSDRTPPGLAVPQAPSASLAQSLGDLDCSYSARPLAAVMNQAASILNQSRLPHRVVVVISDLQARAFEQADVFNRESFGDTVSQVTLIDVGSRGANRSVERLDISPQVAFPGTPIQIRGRLLDSGSESSPAVVSLWVNGKRTSEQAVELKGGVGHDVVFRHTPAQTGDVRYSVRLSIDPLAGDNKRFGVARILAPIRVLLIVPPNPTGAKADEALYLRLALNPWRRLPGRQAPVELTEVSYHRARTESLDAHDVACVFDSPRMPAELTQRLDQHAQQGGRLIYLPALDALPAKLQGETPRGWSFAGLPLAGSETASRAMGPLAIGDYDRKHPLFAPLLSTTPELLSGAAFDAYLAIDEERLGPRDRVPARLSNGAPWIVESRRGAGRVLAWSSGAHPDWNNLALRPLLLPMMMETLKFLGGAQADAPPSGWIDEGFSLNLAQTRGSAAIRVEHPSGRSRPRPVAADATTVRYREVDEPGFYTVHPGGEEVGESVVAVNVDAAEGRVTRATPEAVAAFFPPDRPATIEQSAASVVSRLTLATRGYSGSGALLVLALLALLGQLFVANVVLRHASEPSGQQVEAN